MAKFDVPRDASGCRLCEHCQSTPVPESLGTKPKKYCSRNCRQRAYEARKQREAIVAAVAVAVARDRTSRDNTLTTSRDVARPGAAFVIPASAGPPPALGDDDQGDGLFVLPLLPSREEIEGELARRVAWIEGLVADGE